MAGVANQILVVAYPLATPPKASVMCLKHEYVMLSYVACVDTLTD